MEIRACIACKKVNPAGGIEAPGFSTTAGETEFVQEPYSICDCDACGLLYKTRILSPAQFAEYYDKVSFRKWETNGFYPTERAVLRYLRSLPRGASILDFGCSTGRLLAPLATDYRCFGCEINRSAAREAEGKGVRILSFEELEQGPSYRCDAIVMMDVFEHLERPVELLKMLAGLLNPGGQMIVVTGNGDAKVCRLDPAQFWYFRIVEHVSMLTWSHAKWLEEQLGLKLVRWQPICHYDRIWRAAAGQRLRHFAYWQFRRGRPALQMALRRLPGIRRAEHWPTAPAFYYSPDHVIMILRK